jgi:hypothetical protein
MPPENDSVLAQKVTSELFRDQDIPKGQINIDAVDGVVYPNLLHLPGTPAREAPPRR